LTYLDLNPRFIIFVTYLQLIILSVVGDIFIESETLLLTDFVNLKIKPTQSFRDVYRGRVYTHVFIWRNIRTCIDIYVVSQPNKIIEVEAEAFLSGV
jgi:hypothetical protein